MHKFGSIRGDFRHLRNVQPETQAVSQRLGADTTLFTFYRSRFLDGWVLDNTGVVESGDIVSRAGEDFVVRLRDDRWSVRPRDVHGNTPAGATSIAFGSSAEGSIDPRGDVDWFRFETSGPTTVAVYTTGATDTVGRLFGEMHDGGGGGSNFRIEAAVQAGVHYVAVLGSDPAVTQGDYELHVRHGDLHGDTEGAATPVWLGSSTVGAIGPAGDVDWFRFETSEPQTVAVYTTGATDTVGRLDGEEDDDGGEGLNFALQTAVSGGTHYVRVSGSGSAAGGYTLDVRPQFSENELGMEFAWIRPGSFVMGSPPNEAGRGAEEVPHTVRIRGEFWIGKHEVTQGQWEAVMGSNPSHYRECGSRCPVENVSWNDVQEFIGRLNEREAAGSGARYRLPTEAVGVRGARGNRRRALRGVGGDRLVRAE